MINFMKEKIDNKPGLCQETLLFGFDLIMGFDQHNLEVALLPVLAH